MKKLVTTKKNNSILEIYYREGDFGFFKEVQTVKTSLLNGTEADKYEADVYMFEKFGFNHAEASTIAKELQSNKLSVLFFKN